MAVGGILLKVTGAAGARKLLGKEKGVRAVAAALDALVLGALLVERDAKKNAPVRSGRLRASITHWVQIVKNFVVARIGTNLFYGPLVEFGTGQRGASGIGNLVESAKAAMSRLGFRHGSRAGMSAQPFLFPAYETHRDGIVRRVAEAIRKVMES